MTARWALSRELAEQPAQVGHGATIARAFVSVLDHPYFDVSDTDGSFTLTGAPPGDYALVAWHEAYGLQRQPVHVAPESAAEWEFVYRDR